MLFRWFPNIQDIRRMFQASESSQQYNVHMSQQEKNSEDASDIVHGSVLPDISITAIGSTYERSCTAILNLNNIG